MKIKKVAFWDNELEWRFEPIYFSDLALLVGVSGVGKTQILKVILTALEVNKLGLAKRVILRYAWRSCEGTKQSPSNHRDFLQFSTFVRCEGEQLPF
jgi:hypothetical protein